jgi:hypothetical protein
MIKKQKLRQKLETVNNLNKRFENLFRDKKTIPTKITKEFIKNIKSIINE